MKLLGEFLGFLRTRRTMQATVLGFVMTIASGPWSTTTWPGFWLLVFGMLLSYGGAFFAVRNSLHAQAVLRQDKQELDFWRNQREAELVIAINHFIEGDRAEAMSAVERAQLLAGRYCREADVKIAKWDKL